MVEKKIKLKKYSILLLPEWQPRISFKKRVFSPLAEQVQHDPDPWPQISIKCQRRVEVSSAGSFGVVAESTNDTIKCIKNAPKRQKEKKNVCAASVVGRQLLELLHWAKIGLNGWRYENRSIFFFVVTVRKEKRSFFKIFIFNLLKIGFCQVVVSKTTIFLETFWNEK